MKSVSCSVFHALKKCISLGKEISGIIGTVIQPICGKIASSCLNVFGGKIIGIHAIKADLS